MDISQMVKSMLSKYISARSSDEILLECIITHYFDGDYIEFMEGSPVMFINAMTRSRRKEQMLGKYEAIDRVKKNRQKHSKYRAEENKAIKKDIEKISLLKNNKQGKKIDVKPVKKR